MARHHAFLIGSLFAVLFAAPSTGSFAQTINQLPAATLPVAGTEPVAIWQNGATKKAPVGNIGAATATSLAVSGALTAAPQNVTYTVGSGGNYATLTALYSVLNSQILVTGSDVDVTLLDGVINEPSALYISTPFGKAVNIHGQHNYAFTQSSIVSSSGSAGARSYVLQLNSASNIAVGDYLTITAATGGTNPKYVAGVWPVAAVNAGANQVTVSTTGQESGVASGAVSATVNDYKSTVKFTGTDGFRVWDGATSVNLGIGTPFNIVGNNTAGTNGLSVQDVGRANVGSLSVYGFGFSEILSLYNSEVNAAGYLVASGGNGWGILSSEGGAVDSAYIVATGNAGTGIQSAQSGSINAGNDVTAAGNGGQGVQATQGGSLVVSGVTTAVGNTGSGVTTGTLGVMNLQGTLTSANNGVADQLQFYSPGGIAALGTSTFGYTANQCPGYVACFNGNIRDDATNIWLHNTGGTTTTYFVDSNGRAEIQFRDQSGSSKWEFGHIGSSTYDLQLLNNTLGSQALRIYSSDSHAVFNGTVTPGSVAVGGTNSCSNAGAHAWVTDASVAFASSTRGGQITGSSSNAVPAVCDGTHWLYD